LDYFTKWSSLRVKVAVGDPLQAVLSPRQCTRSRSVGSGSRWRAWPRLDQVWSKAVCRLRSLSRGEARADVFDYIERFYNPRSRHSTLGQVSPDQFEKTRATLGECPWISPNGWRSFRRARHGCSTRRNISDPRISARPTGKKTRV